MLPADDAATVLRPQRLVTFAKEPAKEGKRKRPVATVSSPALPARGHVPRRPTVLGASDLPDPLLLGALGRSTDADAFRTYGVLSQLDARLATLERAVARACERVSVASDVEASRKTSTSGRVSELQPGLPAAEDELAQASAAFDFAAGFWPGNPGETGPWRLGFTSARIGKVHLQRALAGTLLEVSRRGDEQGDEIISRAERGGKTLGSPPRDHLTGPSTGAEAPVRAQRPFSPTTSTPPAACTSLPDHNSRNKMSFVPQHAPEQPFPHGNDVMNPSISFLPCSPPR